MKIKKIFLLLLLALNVGAAMAFTLKSPAFNKGDLIAKTYTCDGADISPPLQWSDLPPGTKSLVLITDDPDAPAGVWDHWVVFNLPISINGLDENLKNLPVGASLGKNSWGRSQYNGPCPPGQEHRYFFKLWALDNQLNLKTGATRKEVEKAMSEHILGTAELMARYKR